ncbi:MAG: thioredoxin domain-containing protein [Chloroflexota bacterium]
MAKKKTAKKRRAAQPQNGQAAPANTTKSSNETQQPARKSRKQQAAERRQKETRMRQIRYGGLALLLVLGLAGLFFWRSANAVPVEELIAAVGPNIDGSPDAPIQVVEYGDFGCHACRQWHNSGAKEQLKAEFGDQVAFEFRHFPVITRQSPKAAEAGQCAAEQGAFWEYHDYVYEETREGDLGTSSLKQFAAAINLDQAAFDSCLDSDKYREVVLEQWRDAQEAGARGTPTFLINGRQVSAQPQVMASAISQLLDN